MSASPDQKVSAIDRFDRLPKVVELGPQSGDGLKGAGLGPPRPILSDPLIRILPDAKALSSARKTRVSPLA